ncbi:MAG: hypothetical protein RL385_1837 [Pseudomonadota bacterium]|jgi:hypothetical protein
MRQRYFTLAEANALVPHLRRRVERMMQLSAHLRLNPEGQSAPTPPGTPWLVDPVLAAWDAPDDEKTRAIVAGLYETLSEELARLEKLGVEVKDLGVGLVAFPSYLDGSTEVRLSWKVSEVEVSHFCPSQGGLRQRRAIDGQSFLAERSRGDLRD